ncbi:hypothetical protein SFRURICE_021067 [Spodoptera frugiperda]|nr:hypothetical protein SFRURICE_021067 [Spodoptera frugiperda]
MAFKANGFNRIPFITGFYPRRDEQRCTRNATVQCTSTFHHLYYKSHIIGREPIAIYGSQFQTSCY